MVGGYIQCLCTKVSNKCKVSNKYRRGRAALTGICCAQNAWELWKLWCYHVTMHTCPHHWIQCHRKDKSIYKGLQHHCFALPVYIASQQWLPCSMKWQVHHDVWQVCGGHEDRCDFGWCWVWALQNIVETEWIIMFPTKVDGLQSTMGTMSSQTQFVQWRLHLMSETYIGPNG